ncbi:hypothetical protein [Rhizobium halophytocola]|uniref:Uncharacterized protein n=1 Tax=Rhizobium halophytocola TaxID=735519 RepID=A0ABS4E1H1_9HYPH|nr:hypothetical protein [Rhizobium halophytocola]MBP1851780.1 hypothetical protein [Rhizobium halophytocola]
MELERDPDEARAKLERPELPPRRPAQSPWLALVAVLVVGLAAWWFMGGKDTDPVTTASTPQVEQTEPKSAELPLTKPGADGSQTDPSTTDTPAAKP